MARGALRVEHRAMPGPHACRSIDPARWLPPGAVVVAACAAVQHWPGTLPADGPVWLTGVAALCLLLRWPAVRRRMAWLPGTRALRRMLAWRSVVGALLLMAVAAGSVAWAMLRAQQALAQRLPAGLEGIEIVVRGVIDEMPLAASRGWRTSLALEACEDRLPGCPVGARLRLHWPAGRGAAGAAAPFVPGERWRLAVRLKRSLSPQNPGLFDAELRALQEGVAATGSVRMAAGARVVAQRLDPLVPQPGALVERARTVLRAAMLRALGDADEAVRGVLVALVVGDQAAIPGLWWERFNRTGVGHLMSISGLHITMLAALGAGLVRRLWRLPLRVPAPGGRARPLAGLVSAPRAAWAGATLVAFGYAGLAGWGLPAQRTCWMVAAAGCAVVLGRARRIRDVLCTAAATVCLLDPWAPMAAGFWLSFAAVGAIVWHGAAARVERPRMLVEAVRTQVAATVALLPLGVLFFASVSLVGPLANAFAIPVVSGLVTPVALAGGLLAPLPLPIGGWLLGLAALATEGLLAALAWCDALPWAAVVLPTPGPAPLLLAVLGCAVLLAPWPVPGRAWATGALLPLLLAPVDSPGPDELRITALDVGQGMAVLIETAEGRLLYDTGPSWSADSDAGLRLVGPYLRARGIDHLQALVVSHADTDHAGGALSLLRQLRVDWVASSLDAQHPVVRAAPRHHRCRAGEQWQWGRTRFVWLHPADDEPVVKRSADNAASCVLRIESPHASAILAGDIEAAQEARILRRSAPGDLRADLLLVPHHGSKTSSTPAFLAAVAPRWAIVQAGYRNRFGHPAPRIMARYRDAGIAILRTDRDGAITLRLGASGVPRIERARADSPRYWRLQAAGAEPAGPLDETPPVSPEDSAPSIAPSIAPSSRRPSPRPRPAPVRQRRNTGTPRARRAARW
jgi:competence protein ComEC